LKISFIGGSGLLVSLRFNAAPGLGGPGPTSRIKIASYAALVVGVASILFVAVLATQINAFYRQTGGQTATSTTSFKATTVSGMLITPPLSLPGVPSVTAGEPYGARLTGINDPFNASQLAIFNDAPQSYFITAAQMYLNKSLSISIGASVSASPLLVANGKPSVIYLGAISCEYCGENRWAMALALGQFGSFQNLFFGYSALGDGDVPTLYWAPANYTASQAVDFGNFYTSNSINFVSMDYASPIVSGFAMGPLTYFQQEATAIANPIYEDAANIIINLNNFQGTPYTIWGKFSVPSADAANFGDANSSATTVLPISSLSHDQVLGLIADPHTPFGWNEYAAADYYIALMCASMSSSSQPPVCSLPSISTMVSQA
jgi:hypothetical protein